MILGRKDAVKHLGHGWKCGWTFRGKFICKTCYPFDWWLDHPNLWLVSFEER